MTLDCGLDSKLCLTPAAQRGNRREEQVYHPDAQPEYMIGLIKDKHDKGFRDEGYSKHAFNDLISRRIGNHREIPDTRHEM